ncbi:MAG: ABC-F family ATP-binding cassette domain-containing protein [Oscillospiraceae bacterium]
MLSAEKISKSYSEKQLLSDCSLYINERDKIGVIGLNGAGKSTLLKILAGVEQPDSGLVTTQTGARIAYLPQNPVFDKDSTVLQQVLANVQATQKTVQEFEAKRILDKLGISGFEDKVSTLSGGQKKRVAMACALITPADLLILDEPTNHLDNDMIAWLENTLIKYSGAILMVTHDRYFLDRVVTRIVEVTNGSLYFYESNYSKYLELKAQREEIEIGAARKRKSLFKKELEWMSRGARARGTKSRFRIERFEELSESVANTPAEKLELNSVTSRLGKKIIEIENLSKAFGEKQLLQNFSHLVARDARIGIVGKNGAGKSTLLNLISGRIAPDSGEIVLGDTVKIAYFMQESTDMDPNMRVIDYVKTFGENIQTIDGTLTASQMLEKFLFPPDLQWNTISRLSGGERRRLYLLTLVMSAPNILLLDEPTNDLDIDTLMILEDYLEGFSGAVLVVSHDRYFLDKVANLIVEIGEDGAVQKYQGSYSDYLQNRPARPEEAAQKAEKAAPRKRSQNAPPQKARFTFKEQREYDVIDSEIEALETAQSQVEADIIAAASDFEKLQTLLIQKEEIAAQLEEKTERWVYLNTIAEQINSEA